MNKDELIDIDDKLNVQRWSTHFNCDENDLVATIKKIGLKASSVKLMLELNRLIKPTNPDLFNDRDEIK